MIFICDGIYYIQGSVLLKFSVFVGSFTEVGILGGYCNPPIQMSLEPVSDGKEIVTLMCGNKTKTSVCAESLVFTCVRV